MRALLFSLCSLLIILLDSRALNSDTPHFFLGNFQFRGMFPDQYDVSISCCPYGRIQMNRDLANQTQILMSADLWVGMECSRMGLKDSSSNLVIPFAFDSSLSQMMSKGQVYSPYGVKFNVSQIARGPIINREDSIDFNITMDYGNVVSGGRTCSVLINKHASIIKVFSGVCALIVAALYL